MKEIAFFKGSEAFYSDLAEYLSGKRVLEVYSGNGLLARKLSDRGVDIKATSLFSGHDGHEQGMHFYVHEMPAKIAAMVHGPKRDVLLVSWPIADKSILGVLESWSAEKPIVYIGEMPNLELPGLMGLSGCACDEFFERTAVAQEFSSYPSTNMLEKAVILKKRNKN